MSARIEPERVVGPAKLTVRKLALKQIGEKHQGHRHKIHHITAVVRGAVMVRIGDNAPYRVDAPNYVFIDKDIAHQFTALTDNVEYWCIFATDDNELTMQRFCEIGECTACVNGNKTA